MQLRMALFAALPDLMSTLAFAEPECEFNEWKSYKDTKLRPPNLESLVIRGVIV